MSRRESRVSINVRQNDALNEFENFKKKFLLANKHITKLNSTLSVRIEELNAHISALHVENLRLRASEIALASQLQREREKTWRIMSEAETATQNLTKHFGNMRKSFSIPHAVPLPAYQSQQSPRARRPTLDPAASPQIARLSRVPNIPGIYEDEEEDESPEEDRIASPTIRRRTKARLSASRLPLPLRVASPPLLPPTLLVEKVKKKSSRRQSGLLTVDTTRPASPAVGSPIQKLAQEIQEDEEIAVVDEMGVGVELEAALNREKKGKAREVEPFDEDSGGRTRERKRRRDEEEISNSVVSPLEGTTKLKDVTNSPRGRAALPPLDTNTSDRERQRTPETDLNTAISAAPSSLMPYPSAQSTPATTPAHTPHPLPNSHESSYLPTPRPSSSPVPPLDSAEADAIAPSGGRATRTRKSVNYAEPKLNTKMRKPDSEAGTSAAPGSKKRLSVSTKPQSQPELPIEEPTPRSSLESAPPPPKKRSSVSVKSQPQVLHSDDPEPRPSFEAVPAPPSRKHVQLQEIKSRPESPPPPPRPSFRPSSSTLFRPISSSHAYVTITPTYPATTSTAATTVKRKKSRPYIDPDDFEESDGAQADAEFGYGGSGMSSGWINVDGRRKSIAHGHGSAANGSSKKMDGDEARRQSLAV